VYGKSGKSVRYIDVLADPANLDEMLRLSGGNRRIPVIVEQGKVHIGLKGRG
jgi:glutaredoxin 3